MNILFFGTGTSTGIPSLCCSCEVCLSNNPRNKRLRSSILVQNNGYSLLVDTSTDLRRQCLTHDIRRIDSVLYTHHHADHVHGIDELRSFTHFNKMEIPCYGSEATLAEIRKNFSYIFSGTAQVGGGLPRLSLQPLPNEAFTLGEISITPLDITHGKLVITGYKLNNAAYITDCSQIPEKTKEKLFGLDLLILNALGFTPHPTHFCLNEALDAIEELKPKQAILTHINHKFDHDKVSADLPPNVKLAFDGMKV